MFRVFLREGETTLEIEHCPRDGIKALDFRRLHGLPDGTDNTIELPVFFADNAEHFCRAHAELLTPLCDLDVSRVAFGVHYHPSDKGEPILQRRRDIFGRDNDDLIPVPPHHIKAFLEAPSLDTLAPLLRYGQHVQEMAEDECNDRYHKQRLKESERDLAARKMQAARELLKDELAAAEETTRKLYLVSRLLSYVPPAGLRAAANRIVTTHEADKGDKAMSWRQIIAEAQDASDMRFETDEGACPEDEED